MRDYIPQGEGDLIKWTDNFAKQFAVYARQLGFTDDEIAAVTGACSNVPTKINASTQAQADAKKAVKEKTTAIATGTKLFRTVAQRSKNAEEYTEEMGKAMGIIGPEVHFDPDTYKPAISASVFPGRITVKFTKDGVQGVNIYSKLKGDANWEKLAFDSYSPYEDNRPLHVPGTPEMRQYAAIGVMHDHEIGQMSDISEVTFGG